MNNSRTEGSLPGWLKEKEPARAAEALSRAPSFFDRMLRGVLSFLEDTLFNETVSQKNGFLQRTDARVKLFATLALLVSLSFEREVGGMLPYIGFALFFAALSKVPLSRYFKRIFPAFILTALIALPASFNLVVKGERLFSVFSAGGLDLYVTRQGALSAIGLLARVTASLMLVFLAGFTTNPSGLIKSAGAFLPGVLRTLIAVSYRYIFFLMRRLEEFILAQKSRGAGGRGFSGRRWAGNRAAALVLISMDLKEDLRMAMEARGMTYGAREYGEKLRPGLREALLALASLGVILA